MKPDDFRRKRSMGKAADSTVPMQEMRQDGSSASSRMGLRPSTHFAKSKKAHSNSMKDTPPVWQEPLGLSPLIVRRPATTGGLLCTLKVVSLYELMFEYAINVLVQGVAGLIAVKATSGRTDPLSPVDPSRLKNLGKILTGLHVYGREIGLDSTLLNQIEKLHDVIMREDCRTPTLAIETRLDGIIQGIVGNLDSKKFMFVPTDQASYWENRTIFGDDFWESFGSAARFEAVEAGNCYAAGRWTACVFHSMRVAEYGLRKLGRTLKVTIGDRGKTCPLEYGDWDKVITAIRNKIAETRRIPAGKKKAEILRAYSQAADHCEYMKDIWRNEISHTRRQYSKTESLGVMNRVREFMLCAPLKPKTQGASPGVS